jgi:hypothetical protein
MKTALLLASTLLAAAAAGAAPPAANAPTAPVRADHPMLGAWQITRRDDGCAETYRVDRSGRTLVTSADEVAQTRFTLSDQPSAKGYYKWVDTLVKDNGKKDCWGQVTKPGKTTVRYVMMNPARNRFIICTAEDGAQCFGPFVKVEGGEI